MLKQRSRNNMPFAEIPTAVAALQAGLPIIAVDDEDRENEGDIIMAAQYATSEWLAWIIRVSSGFVCAPMSNERADALDLPLMTEDNKDALRTAYTITVDAAGQSSTGISATDRARTLRVLADPESGPVDLSLRRPGAVVAYPGGLLRQGEEVQSEMAERTVTEPSGR